MEADEHGRGDRAISLDNAPNPHTNGEPKPPNECLKSEDCRRLHDCAFNPPLVDWRNGGRAFSEIFQRLAGVQSPDDVGGDSGAGFIIRSRICQIKSRTAGPPGYEPRGVGGSVPGRHFCRRRLFRANHHRDPAPASPSRGHRSIERVSRLDLFRVAWCLGLVTRGYGRWEPGATLSKLGTERYKAGRNDRKTDGPAHQVWFAHNAQLVQMTISRNEVIPDSRHFSFPPGVFLDLESLFPTNCTDSEKIRTLVALLQIALRPEDDL
jgi:hypothetical protein